MAKKPLDEKSYGHVVRYIEFCITDPKYKTLLASHFAGKQSVHGKFGEEMKKFISPEHLSDEAVAQMELDENSLEYLCDLADKTNQYGLGCILKRIYASEDDGQILNPLYDVVKTMKGRKLLNRLLWRLMDYKPIADPGCAYEDRHKYGYDHEKTFSNYIFMTIRDMQKYRNAFLERIDYMKLFEPITKIYLESGGGPFYPALFYYGVNWFFEKDIEDMRDCPPIDGGYDPIYISANFDGPVRADLLKDYATVYSGKITKGYTGLLKIILKYVAMLPNKEAEEVFIHVMDLYINAKDISWRTFVDMALGNGNYDRCVDSRKTINIAKSAKVWEEIVSFIPEFGFISGKDCEYFEEIVGFLNSSQKLKIKEKLERLFPEEIPVAKLYKAVKAYGADTSGYPKKTLEQFELFKISEGFKS